MVPLIVDSNIWIFSEIEEYPENKIARDILIDTINSKVAIINPIIISETYHKLSIIVGSERAKIRLLHMLENERIIYLQLGKNTLRKAILLAANKNIRINDAIIAQQCLEENQELLTDNIKDFKKIDGLNLIPLR